jgi:glutathione S-transferase
MKLHWAPTSPYVRKVMVAAHELDLARRLTLVPTTPETVVADVAADNPLAQIPTLVLDDGTRLYDSTVICLWLDSQGGGRLLPAAGPARWRALARHALGQGLIDAAIGRVRELRRPAGERSPSFLAKRAAEIARALDALEAAAPTLAPAPGLAEIAAGVALGYLEFRGAEEPWRLGRTALAAWFDALARRPSFVATQHPRT